MEENTVEFLDQDGFITLLAQNARFSKNDVKIIYDEMIGIFEDAVRKNVELKIRSFGHLYTSIIPPRIGIKNKMYPEAKKIIFKLSENIRDAHKREDG